MSVCISLIMLIPWQSDMDLHAVGCVLHASQEYLFIL